MADKPTNESHWKKVARLLGDDISSTAGTAKDIVGRGVVAPIMGLPVDMFNLGARRPEHKGSSEFFGEQMEDAGVVSPDRNPKSELLASLLNPASFAAKAAAIPALAATFAGKGAKGANLSKLFKAEEMLKKGGSDRDAYAKTGWTHGFPDKKPRFEIDDSGSTSRTTHWNQIHPSKAIEHPTLYDEYPILNKIEQSSTKDYKTHGMFSPYVDSDDGSLIGGRINIFGPNKEEIRSTGLHELQHAVQNKEGHALGGSASEFKDAYKEQIILNKRIGDLQNKKTKILLDNFGRGVVSDEKAQLAKLDREIAPLKAQIKTMKAQEPYEQYRKLAGEVEARLTQDRMNMTAAERAKSYPPDMFDVPVEDQIVRFDGGKQMMSEGKKLTEGEKIAFKPKIDYLKKMEKCVGKGYSNCHLAAQLTSGETDFSKLKNINIPEESPIVSEWFDKGGTSGIEKILKEGDILNFSKRHYGIYDGKDIIQVPEWGGKPERVNMKSVFESYNPPTQIITPSVKSKKKPTKWQY